MPFKVAMQPQVSAFIFAVRVARGVPGGLVFQSLSDAIPRTATKTRQSASAHLNMNICLTPLVC